MSALVHDKRHRQGQVTKAAPDPEMTVQLNSCFGLLVIRKSPKGLENFVERRCAADHGATRQAAEESAVLLNAACIARTYAHTKQLPHCDACERHHSKKPLTPAVQQLRCRTTLVKVHSTLSMCLRASCDGSAKHNIAPSGRLSNAWRLPLAAHRPITGCDHNACKSRVDGLKWAGPPASPITLVSWTAVLLASTQLSWSPL
jgi:hypothetical protein